MATANLGRKTIQIDPSLDGIVIVNCLSDLPGGCTLDVSGVASGITAIHAGHVIAKTAAGEYKPLGISSGAYVALAEGEKYAGVLKATCLVADPRAAILTAGQVNAAASPAPVTAAIKNALSRIEFLY